ncbi:MAG TPA: alkaline phosphatase family protein [Gemmatimonadaceae bacterium]|jgi:predicted AlkP superfamily pyrophosphatase or phosphodiesterase
MRTFFPRVRRVTVVVLDGLRPDAIEKFSLYTVARLAEQGASTLRGRSVTPSVTAAAMATLLTGASPERHGLQSDRFQLPRARGLLHPWPKMLSAHQLETTVLMARIPSLFMPVARGFASLLGVSETRFAGDRCGDIVSDALGVLERQRTGVVMLHLPDADRAGHAHGWMSPEYADAAGRMDNALGRLVRAIDLDDPAELVIACADHGGGGARPTAHDSDHPADTTVPVVLAGGDVFQGDLGPDVAFADLPATVVWSLGLPIPATYAGQPLCHAFQRSELAA